MVSQQVDGSDLPQKAAKSDEVTAGYTSGADSAPQKGAKSRKSDRSAKATGSGFAPMRRGRNKAPQPAEPTPQDATDVEPQQAATASAAVDEPKPQDATAAEPQQPATEQPVADAAAPGAVVPLRQRGETASERVARLKHEINALADRHGALGEQIAQLAILCESGDTEALSQRRDLRGQIAEIVDRIDDKKAALAAAEPLAAVEARHEAVQRRNAALDQASAYFGHVEGWGEQIDKALGQLLMAFKNMRTCQTAAIATMHYHTPESMRWLLEMNEGALQGVLMARLVREGILGADEFDPGPAFTGRVTVGMAVAQHVDAVRERIAALRADERVADPSEIIAQSNGSVWDPPSANRPHRFTHTIGPAIGPAIAKD